MPILVLLTVHVWGGKRTPQTDTQQTEREEHTKDRFRETSKERKGEPQTQSRQMEEPESPRAAL